MKKSLFIATAVLSTLLLVGCTQKEVTKKVIPTKGLGSSIDNPIKTETNANRSNVDKYGGTSDGYSYDTDYDRTENSLKNIYFDVDKYIITPDKLSIIANNAKILKKYVKDGVKIKIEGNCDATGTDEYNYALGLRRAKATKEALITKGIKPSNIVIVSLGESSPECTTDYSSACYAKNRRVEFKVLK
jgi:peptidoglycan-associated lipoprotein